MPKVIDLFWVFQSMGTFLRFYHMNEKVNSEDFDWIDVYKMMGVK